MPGLQAGAPPQNSAHARILRRARRLARWSQCYERLPDGVQAAALRARITTETDRLLGAMLDAFDSPAERGDPAGVEDLRRVFAAPTGLLGKGGRDAELPAARGMAGDFAVTDDPAGPAVADRFLPAAVMRELCHMHHLPFEHARCRNWPRFVDRYVEAMSRI